MKDMDHCDRVQAVDRSSESLHALALLREVIDLVAEDVSLPPDLRMIVLGARLRADFGNLAVSAECEESALERIQGVEKALGRLAERLIVSDGGNNFGDRQGEVSSSSRWVLRSVQVQYGHRRILRGYLECVRTIPLALKVPANVIRFLLKIDRIERFAL